ncbi:MAG: 5'/3'-nucleotidase SurE [Proteobacteria bacterium]|nr:5'/3'-nucleotidase SurE [Pseudomonadota bacterium]
MLAISLLVHGEQPLHVLLTNDDGFDAPGITAMREALVNAGYKVSVAAPREQQSGSSMKVTLGAIEVEQTSERFWIIDGTPADSVSFALLKLLPNSRPDIVISGINFGQNLGTNTNLSGTVGAAIMATQFSVPAIAVSVGLDLAESGATPVRFPSTMAAFAPAADFTAKVLRQLELSREPTSSLLPASSVLNINYPAIPREAIKGVRMARVAQVGGFVPNYLEGDVPGKYTATLVHGAPEDSSRADPDIALFSDGYITISVLDGDLNANGADNNQLKARIEQFFSNPVK